MTQALCGKGKESGLCYPTKRSGMRQIGGEVWISGYTSDYVE